jgi:hypothetical protein
MTITKITTTTTTANPFALYYKAQRPGIPPGLSFASAQSRRPIPKQHGMRSLHLISWYTEDTAMKTFPRLVIPALALSLTASTPLLAQYGTQPPRYDQGYPQGSAGWDMPPQEFRDVQRQGFHDGIEGARKDFDNHRHPDVNNRDEYRHPHVPRSARRDYREGFERGYQVAVAHLYGQDNGRDRDRGRDHDHDYDPH